MSRLIFLTTRFPYSNRQQWKENELLLIKYAFDEVAIVPFIYTGNDRVDEINGIEVWPPVFSYQPYLKLKRLRALISPRFKTYFKEFFRQGVFRSREKLIKFLDSVNKTELMVKGDFYKRLNQLPDKENTILYFYWGVGSSLLVPYLYGFKKIIVRFHGYDLYDERNNGYIPFREDLVRKLDNAVFISNHGMRYMLAQYPGIKGKEKMFRLGTKFKGLSKVSTDGVLRVYSCSEIKPLKRVDLILNAVRKVNFPVIWTHIGGGDGIELMRKATENLPANVSVNLVGVVRSEEVMNYYINQPVDLFVNASTTEGVPVSVMEALSAGIPVIATSVGGTGEIVDECVGKLVDADLDATRLAQHLLWFYNLDKNEKLKMREAALNRFKERSDADKLNRSFIDFLLSLK